MRQKMVFVVETVLERQLTPEEIVHLRAEFHAAALRFVTTFSDSARLYDALHEWNSEVFKSA